MTGPTKQAVIVCAAGGGNPLREVGGLTLAERLMRQLSELDGIEEILVIRSQGISLPLPSKRVRARVHYLDSQCGEPWEMLREVGERLRDRFLVVAGDLLVDQRLFAWLVAREQDTLIRPSPTAPPEFLGSISPTSFRRFVPASPSAVLISATAFPTYWTEQRGDVPLHLLRVATSLDEAKAWEVLLDSVQKRALDLPARTFDPPFENLLVRWLSPTRITPNQVTVATGVFGFLVTALFATGWLRVGVLLAIAVEVLDGVDGKLARIKRMTSRIGELEHVLDFFYENSWYVALGAFLSAQGVPWAWGAALAMVTFDLTDNLANLLFSHWQGRTLAEASSFLRRFCMVSGRRNIYAWIFLPGFLVGGPASSFAFAVAWAGVTAAVHVTSASAYSLGIIRQRPEALALQGGAPKA